MFATSLARLPPAHLAIAFAPSLRGGGADVATFALSIGHSLPRVLRTLAMTGLMVPGAEHDEVVGKITPTVANRDLMMNLQKAPLRATRAIG